MISTLFLLVNRKSDCLQLSLFNMDCLCFIKSGILIFLFAENNYSIYAHTMLIKTPLFHQSFGPSVFLSLSLSLSLPFSLSLSLSGWSPRAQKLSEFTFLPGPLRPSQEGALCLHPIERVPEAFVNRASPMSGTLLVFCVKQGISATFSLLYFLISRLQTTGSGPLKDLNRTPGS